MTALHLLRGHLQQVRPRPFYQSPSTFFLAASAASRCSLRCSPTMTLSSASCLSHEHCPTPGPGRDSLCLPTWHRHQKRAEQEASQDHISVREVYESVRDHRQLVTYVKEDKIETHGRSTAISRQENPHFYSPSPTHAQGTYSPIIRLTSPKPLHKHENSTFIC